MKGLLSYAQNIPTANQLNQKNSQYVKIVPSILGVAIFESENNIQIHGDYKLFKNDEFTWQI